MKTSGKHFWMTWIIVILVLLNISTIITVLYQKNKAAKNEVIYQPAPETSDNTSMKYSGRWFRDYLGFSREQMDRFVEFNMPFRQKVRSINLKLNNLRDEMLAEMESDRNDTAKLNLLSDSIGYLHSDLKKATYKYFLDLKSICDSQQQEKLEELFSEIFASDVQMMHPGKGGPGRMRRGRPF